MRGSQLERRETNTLPKHLTRIYEDSRWYNATIFTSYQDIKTKKQNNLNIACQKISGTLWNQPQGAYRPFVTS